MMKGKPYLRLMQPMITRTGCLKCHGFQGYSEGDVRGGVGISLPLAPLVAVEQKVIRTLYLSHGVIWLLGLTGITVAGVRAKAASGRA